jgi:hypothetical protein
MTRAAAGRRYTARSGVAGRRQDARPGVANLPHRRRAAAKRRLQLSHTT